MQSMSLHSIYERLGRLEVRHATLLHVLQDYAQPNKKIHDMVQRNDLLPLTREFFLLSPEKLKQPYQPGVIANLMHGPSYVSLETALSYYGLIPESTPVTTSITTKRSKTIQTPIGTFTYDHLIQNKYVVDVQQARGAEEEQSRYLIASPTKALMDYITFRITSKNLKTTADVSRFLREDIRFDLNRYRELTPLRSLDDLKEVYARSIPHARTLRFLSQGLA